MERAPAATLDGIEWLKPFTYEPDKKSPFRFTWLSLFFIYVLQYPLTQLLPADAVTSYGLAKTYGYSEWLVAYGFVIASTLIFVSALYGGMSGQPVTIHPPLRSLWKVKKRPVGFPLVVLAFGVFFVWSYLMLKLHIGMTIHGDFDPLPFKMAGFLFYGRLLIQPLVLAYIADSYSASQRKWIVLAMLAALGGWAALTSGSRFVGIVFAAPVLLLFQGKGRYVAFAVGTLVFMAIANATRSLYLPYELGDKYIAIYANDETQAATTEDVPLTTLTYLITRPMGMHEVLQTLDYGNIASNIQDSAKTFFAFFLPYVAPGNTATIKDIYGLPEDAFGGYGLDLFSNFWVGLGGSPVLYGLGVALMGWMLGRTYRCFAIGITRFGFYTGTTLIFVLLFILVFEGRGLLSPWILLAGWLFSRESTSRLAFSLFRNPYTAA